ncbi:uncharacterized protein [Palaemon carinicauda]|uniref:uncharacterized protein n=1 Tax=Palaemon carinicauda TaxID=392227 RepID=UPI0035B65F0E
MFGILNSLKLSLYLNAMLAISVRPAYSETGTCSTVTEAAETTFKNGIKLQLYIPNDPPSMFKLSFVGDEFPGKVLCFTWDPIKYKYKIETYKYNIEKLISSQTKDFGGAGWKTLLIRVTASNMIILVDETNQQTLPVRLRKARYGACYAVALHSETFIDHAFTHSDEIEVC